jgi:hypothetical protein
MSEQSPELSPEGRAFVQATRPLDEPSDHDRERIRARMLAAIAAAGASALPAKAAAAAAASVGQGLAPPSVWGGVIVGALLGVAAVGVEASWELVKARAGGARTAASAAAYPGHPGASAGRPEPLSFEAPHREPPFVQTASSAPAIAGHPAAAPKPAASAPSVPAPEPSVAAEAPAASSRALDDELAALRAAQEAIHAGKPDEAMRVLDRFGASHAGGALEEERRAARIIAACARGGPEAHADAERFLRERPASPLCERVRAACSEKATP